MKEFLDTAKLYTYVKDTAKRSEDWIEIPEGAEIYLDNTCFYKLGNPSKVYISHEWEDVAKGYHTISDFIKAGDVVLWQREKVKVEVDNVNHPKHYTGGDIECIDSIQASMTKEAFLGFLKGNVQKYMWRYEDKGGSESLRKAQWYLSKIIDILD